MLKRIQSGWSFIRIIYLIFGGFIVVQSILDLQWFGMLVGVYFASMGLFGFACASGNCFGKINSKKNALDHSKLTKEIDFEEVI